MIKRECVDQNRWVSEDSFRQTLAVHQVLPGPEAHELCVYFGRLRGGNLSSLLAGLGSMRVVLGCAVIGAALQLSVL